MTKGTVSPSNEKTPVKLRNNPFDGAFFELETNPSEKDKITFKRNSDPQSSELLSTTDLISAVGNAWGRAKKPLSVLLPKTNSTCKPEVIQGGEILRYPTDEGTISASTSADDQPSTKLVQEHLKVNEKSSCPRYSYEFFSLWRIILERPKTTDVSFTENLFPNTGIPPRLGSIYEWMSERAIAKENSLESERKKTSNCYSDHFSSNGRVPADTPSVLDNSTTEISASNLEATKCLDLSFGKASSSENDIVHSQHVEETELKILTSKCDANSQDTSLATSSHECAKSTKESKSGPDEHRKDVGSKCAKPGLSELEMSLSAKEKPTSEKPQYSLAKQEHAFAGAMAGVFVSLCLHPIDTIKTVVQSCHADQKSLHNIGRSIIAERGILGLYRGISSNIVSSAPISAVYTFTYESVKKSLLPLLPKEYQSLAHCTAGGCASIATSFIFTPSERIKQQMQVGSHYRNCWNAFIQVIKKGGLPSLYAGWGAVLCRNVPHSVIKFYTYESLKQIMLPSIQPNMQPNIFVTLVCGGLAGSTASLFTTPFDVVKTRLQTQIPGSTTQYNGVFNSLTEIGKHEGLKGLYRGLTPRLVMYMIQGALFFASYESFKRLFSLEVPQLSACTIQHQQKEEDDSNILPSTISVTA